MSSCSFYEINNSEPGANFIENKNKLKINIMKVKLSSSYKENGKNICIYISKETKIITETLIDLKCPSEI